MRAASGFTSTAHCTKGGKDRSVGWEYCAMYVVVQYCAVLCSVVKCAVHYCEMLCSVA